MRVVHVCSGHRVNDSRVFQRECVSLSQAGYDVHLIATGTNSDASIVNGVSIHPLPQAVSRKERIARRTQVARLAASLDADLFHVQEPELLGAVLKVAGSKPVIYDVHETYVDSILERDWIPKPLRPLVADMFNRIEGSLVRRCAAVIVATDYLAPRYIKLGREKTVTLANYPRLSEYDNIESCERPCGSCVFIGSISRTRGVSESIIAVENLNQRGIRATFDLAGWGDPTYQLEIQAGLHPGGPVRYHGRLGRSEALELANRNAIGLVPHWRNPKMEKAWPVKMMEYMALGLPAIYSGLGSHIELAQGKEIGVCIDNPKNPESIADAISYLIREPERARAMGQAGKEIVSKLLNWEKESIKLVELYKEVI